MTVVIADPTAWVPAVRKLDRIDRERACTNYLPGFNIFMLLRALSDDFCSLHAHEQHLTLGFHVIVH